MTEDFVRNSLVRICIISIINFIVKKVNLALNNSYDTIIFLFGGRCLKERDFILNKGLLFPFKLLLYFKLNLFFSRYEFKEKGLLKEEDSSNVPDVYIR